LGIGLQALYDSSFLGGSTDSHPGDDGSAEDERLRLLSVLHGFHELQPLPRTGRRRRPAEGPFPAVLKNGFSGRARTIFEQTRYVSNCIELFVGGHWYE